MHGNRDAGRGSAHDANEQEEEVSDFGDFPVVCLGASAGGLCALEEFFSHLGDEADAAFVVIQHLSPDHPSHLDQLIQRQTQLRVSVIDHDLKICPGRVYVLPSNADAILCNGRFVTAERRRDQSSTTPIDDFLRSLATEIGSKGVAVILSGAGTDGSRGARCVREAGGLVIAQTPASASFSGMPQSVISAGIADLILSPAQAAKAVVRNFPTLVNLNADSIENDARQFPVDPSSIQVLDLLQHFTRLEYSDFLPSVLSNAVASRAKASRTESLDDYEEMFDAEEAERLHGEIVGNSQLSFGDLEAIYERMAVELLPSLLGGVPDDQNFRAWIIGCGAGEEAYTLAMLLYDWFEQKELPHRVKIFASDTDNVALARASKAVFRWESLEGLTDCRRDKFFIERPDGFHIIPELRKMVVFTQHSCLHEAPFTKLDFISCRKLITRWIPTAQAKALSLIHFALRESGGLLLDPALGTDDVTRDFHLLDNDCGLFNKRRWTLTGKLNRGTRLNADMELLPFKRSDVGRVSQRELLELYDQILDSCVSAGWLVTDEGKLLHTFGSAGEFCLQKGRSSNDIVSIAHEELRFPLMLLLRHINETRSAIEINNIQLPNVPDKGVSLRGEPLTTRSGRNGILVSIVKPQATTAVARRRIAAIDFGCSTDTSAGELQRELAITRENLQLTIHDLRLANEELQEINEELTCANEELQSANEELHSVNEELHTVNTEHQRKIDELTSLNDDLDNLLTNSNVHTLFLTSDLRLRLFTPRIVELLNLIPQDIGRHIRTFNHSLCELELVKECEEVVRTDCVLHREVECLNGAWYMMRIAPYVSRGNTDGVVITFVDISLQKNTQAALLSSEQRFELATQGSSDGIWDWPNVHEERIWGSPRLYEILGHNPLEFELTHSMWIELVHPEDRHSFKALLDGCRPFKFECRIIRPDGELRWVRICGASIRDGKGASIRMAGSLEDVTDRRVAQEEVKQAVKLREQFLAMLSHELRNPLGAVISAMQMYDEDVQQRDRALDIVRRQSQQMSRLLEDLLDVSRVCHGKFEIERKQVSLNQVVMSAVECMSASLHKRQMTLDCQCSESEIFVIGDAARLQQVIVNLLNNAIKFSKTAGHIELSLRGIGRDAFISIRDYGVGMTEEFRTKAFEMFVQSDATLERSNGGMGLGLTLAKVIVEMHGGRLQLKSAGLNQGCELCIQLKRADSPTGLAETTTSPAKSTEEMRVVVVEDMDDLRDVLGAMLTLRGHKPVLACDGREGLELIQQVKPDVALVDIGLPHLNGFEIAQALRAQPEYDGVRLIALTGYGQAADREAVVKAGFDSHIVKPFNPRELYDVMVDNTKCRNGAHTDSQMKAANTFEGVVDADHHT